MCSSHDISVTEKELLKKKEEERKKKEKPAQ